MTIFQIVSVGLQGGNLKSELRCQALKLSSREMMEKPGMMSQVAA